MRTAAIVLAGGKGSRMKSDIPKQYLEILGKPLLYYTLRAFELSETDEIILVTGRGEEEYCRRQIVEEGGFRKVRRIVPGGRERYDSVYEGLKACDTADHVLIHDGARCCLKTGFVNEMIAKVRDAGACIAAVRAKDTVKTADAGGRVTGTLDRECLWNVQTPQAFAYKTVKKAYDAMYAFAAGDADRTKLRITDDAMVVERFSDAPVYLCEGDYTNIKVTTPEDLILAERFLSSEKK